MIYLSIKNVSYRPVDILENVALADKEEILDSDDVVHGVSEDLSLGQPACLEHLEQKQSRDKSILEGKFPIQHRPPCFLVRLCSWVGWREFWPR